VELFAHLASEQNVEADAAHALLIECLRAEIAFLSARHRQITMLFYYENKTSAEIAVQLGIPHATVRWHLTEIKKKLKVGMEMENKLSYMPKRLNAGHDGWTNDSHMHGIGENPLVDSICVACYGNELTIEALSRALQVAAAYIEPLVDDLVDMDYLRVVGKNKFTTNFFIQDARFGAAVTSFKCRNIGPYAEKLGAAFRKRLDAIKAIGFVGSDLDDDFLVWAIMPLVLEAVYWKSSEVTRRKNNAMIETPLRKDGTRHWVCAWLADEAVPTTGVTPEELAFAKMTLGNGVKLRGAETGEHSLQYDSYATIQQGIHWREFGTDSDLRGIRRVAELVRSGEAPNEYDRMMIAAFAAQGYAAVENGKPKLLVPFFDVAEFAKLDEIIDEIKREVGEDLFVPYIEAFGAAVEKQIPVFITAEERAYIKYKDFSQYAVMYWLSDNGLLRYPTDDEAKRLCTVVWQA